jgi:hypothetical protein
MTLKSTLNRLSGVGICSSSVLAATAALLIACSAPAFPQSDPNYPGGGAKEAAPAQEMPGGMMGGRSMMGMMMRGGGMMGMMGGQGMMGVMESCPMMGGTAHSEGRIAFLKAELAITDQQKEVWDAYAAALKKNLEGMRGMRLAMMKVMQAKSPVERLDAHVAAMESRLAALRELKPALANLYSALSEEQRKKADEFLTGMGCMM